MKFSEVRQVAIKRTEDDDKHFDVTPRRLSPFKQGTTQIKDEFKKDTELMDEMRWPTYNRERRRENGQIRKPNRTTRQLPPHPLAVINRAHQIEREGERLRQKAIRQAERSEQ